MLLFLIDLTDLRGQTYGSRQENQG